MKRILALILSLSLALSLTACGGSDNKEANTDADNQVADTMFNVTMSSTFVGFHPLKVNDSSSGILNSQFYETLYLIQKDGSYENLLAEEAPVFSDDGMSATIKLREGINFQDGTPFNAEAVKYNIEKVGDPEYGAARSSLVNSIESVEVVDEYTVKLNLVYSDAVLQAKLSHSSISIVSPTADQKQDLMIEPCGTGAYRLVSTVSGANVVVTRNDDYWGEAPAIKDATFTIVTEESTAIGRLQTGETDCLTSVTADAESRVKSIPGVTLGEADTAVVSLVLLRPTSYKNPLMADKEFRTTIVKAIDRDSFLEFILNGRGDYSDNIMCKGVFGRTDKGSEANIDYDPEGAKAAVIANGWQDEPISILCASTATYVSQAEYYQSNLKEAGFNNVTIETTDWGTFVSETTVEDRFDITMINWANSIRDGSEMLSSMFSSTLGTRARIDSAEIDGYLEKAKQTTVPEEREEYLEAASMYIASEAYAFPAYYGKSYYAFNSDKYKNVEIWINTNFYLQDIEPA